MAPSTRAAARAYSSGADPSRPPGNNDNSDTSSSNSSNSSGIGAETKEQSMPPRLSAVLSDLSSNPTNGAVEQAAAGATMARSKRDGGAATARSIANLLQHVNSALDLPSSQAAARDDQRKPLFPTEVSKKNTTKPNTSGLFGSSAGAGAAGGAMFPVLLATRSTHIVHVKSSRNNTIATVTDGNGNALAWASAGTIGLKKSHRGSSDAGYQAVLQLKEKLDAKRVDLMTGDNRVELRLNGYGPGREMAFRATRAMGWNLRRVTDVTPIRHAGCRPKRKRRL
ncbi:hypothetical protein HDU83_000177 [Entophlyctis luteolus]|nr:hypothetical protein HDU83_000177 [Entophlyctis luteolus]